MTTGDDEGGSGPDRASGLIELFSRFADVAPPGAAAGLVELGRQFDVASMADEKADARVGRRENRGSPE